MSEFDTQKKVVLVVDDDPILSAIAQVFFQKRGWTEVHSAKNGREALEFLDDYDGCIDFMLCDLNMPEMDGIEYLRHLKERAYSGAIAILSGERDSIVKTAETLAGIHNLQIVGSLRKPLKIRELEALVEGLGAKTAHTVSDKPILLSINDLRIALASGHIMPFYQPKIETRTGKIVGVEALARWRHPGFGLISPGFFIPMAETNELIDELTEVIIGCAVRDVAMWLEQGMDLSVSLNISASTLNNLSFPDELAILVGASGVDSAHIVLEITESNLVQKTAISSEVLARLRLMGFGISIDDFGTGYSNMEQLREFPFSELKIDQSFIRGATKDQFARASVEASVTLGKQLDLRLVAEGVETEEDWNFVVNAGIDEVQGYYIARPMPAEDFSSWCRQRSSPRRAAM
jgi:EAL domain-containing protein (putative c-di-GMP-specific phosphodiesterase class I)/FixJ family two-component response regulator